MSKNYNVDICVIGAGSGGLSVAAGAVQLGMSVALIEGHKMGGDCLNTGCVPSKALLAMGKKYAEFSKAHEHVRDVITTIEPHDSVERFEGLGVQVIQGYAKFADKNRVITDKDDRIKAKFIVIATGSSAFIPPIKGLDKDKILTNENIFDLKEKPDHLIIVGGGPIGVEMAQAHADLGCKVTLIDMGSIMMKDDPELVAVVREKISEKITLMEQAAINGVTHTGDGHTVSVTDQNGKESNITGSHILVATGRAPNVKNLDLDKAGIVHSRRGITVNKRLQAGHKHIYAIGDCAEGAPQFTHIAGYHAGIIIRNICFRMPAKVNYKTLPWVTYTAPELANVGMTEDMAVEEYGADAVRCLTFDIKGNDRALAEGKTDGLIKVVGLKKNGKILGAGIVGDNAGEFLMPWSLAIAKSMKFKDIAGLIVPYPTVSEINKRVAGAWYTDSLFSDKTHKIIGWLQKLPIF